MYMCLPVTCSSASDTDATSTRRKSAIRGSSVRDPFGPVTPCARSILAPHKRPPRNAVDRTKVAMVWAFRKPRNLFISHSSMYICARTLPLFFAAWKSQSFITKGNGNENCTPQENSSAIFVCVRYRTRRRRCSAEHRRPAEESGESIRRQGTSFQRRDHRRKYSVHRRSGGYG